VDDTVDDSPTYGFIGLGNIGGPMARRLTDWPGGLVVRDLDPDRVAPLVADGAVAVEPHIEDPKSSAIFAEYPQFLKDPFFLHLLCEGHNERLQNFLRSQQGSSRSLVLAIATLNR